MSGIMARSKKITSAGRQQTKSLSGNGRAARQADGRQALKSASTRAQIVEAAIRCLVKYGYAHTTTPRIAEEAGVSRGAMTHHFASRLHVIQAAIEHLHQKRLRAFRRAAVGVPGQPERAHDALMGYWQHVTHPLFVAFHELTVAARTDPELDHILKKARRDFYQEWYSLAIALFPEWQSNPKNFNLALSLTQNLLEGMAISQLSGDLTEETRDALLQYLEEQLLALSPATNPAAANPENAADAKPRARANGRKSGRSAAKA